jgi:L-lactate dehydrogenase complex protein LldG
VTARDEVLADVRRALAGADRSAPHVPRGYRDRRPAGDLLARFVERVEDYRATVTRCAPDEVEDTLRAVLGARRAVVPDGFPHAVDGGVPDDGLDARALDHLDAVVTTATVAIAETGTIVLDHGPGQGRRALSLVPDLHLCVVRADQVVADVPAAIALLDPARPQTWISGPSATSDIELTRVEGVHGPRTLHVLLTEPEVS